MESKENELHNSPVEPLNHFTDLTYLTEFCENDETRIRKYISLFLDSVPVVVDKFSRALEDNDIEEIARQIHGFKTRCMMMGMSEAERLSVKIEQDCRNSLSLTDEMREDISRFVVIINEAAKSLTMKISA